MVDSIIKYEQGDMDEAETVTFFQKMIDSGLVWSLQGHYARMANLLIDSGQCKVSR